jgi:purine-cytosine permease-like protein
MIGFMLAQNYGFGATCSSIIIANLIISLLATPIANSAVSHKLTATLKVKSLFGDTGSKISAVALGIVLIGWFGINIEAASKALKTYSSIDSSLINAAIGGVIIAIVSCGIKGLEKVADIVVPIFVIAIGYSLVTLGNGAELRLSISLPDIKAIMIALAAPFTILFDLPTYYRFAKSKKDSTASIIISLFISMSIVEIIGAIMYALTLNQRDIVDALLNSGSNQLTMVNLVAILLGTLIVNNCNLYSASANAEVLLGKNRFKTAVLILGVIGIAVSYLNVIENLEFVLDGITILIGSITSVLVLESILKQRFKGEAAILGIMIGSLLGFMALFLIIKVRIAAFLFAGIVSACITLVGVIFNNLVSKENEKIA